MEIQGRPSNVNRHGIWKFRAVLTSHALKVSYNKQKTDTHTRASTHASTHSRTRTYTRTIEHTHTYTHARTHSPTHVRTHKHTHMHTPHSLTHSLHSLTHSVQTHNQTLQVSMAVICTESWRPTERKRMSPTRKSLHRKLPQSAAMKYEHQQMLSIYLIYILIYSSID